VTSVAGFYAAWIWLGLGMAATLYNPAFAVVTRRFAQDFRRAIITLTFLGGLASTVFIPLFAWWMELWGWRQALWALAALQLLVYPMLDDRTALRDVDDRLHRLWDPASNRVGWSAYLGRAPGGDGVPDHAAPARRRDLAGLPPAWIGVGTADLFHDEDVTYAARLRDAGVPVTLDVVEGAFHAFDVVAPNTAVSRRFFDAQVAAIEGAWRPART
jgi:MFS family permease